MKCGKFSIKKPSLRNATGKTPFSPRNNLSRKSRSPLRYEINESSPILITKNKGNIVLIVGKKPPGVPESNRFESPEESVGESFNLEGESLEDQDAELDEYGYCNHDYAGEFVMVSIVMNCIKKESSTAPN